MRGTNAGGALEESSFFELIAHYNTWRKYRKRVQIF